MVTVRFKGTDKAHSTPFSRKLASNFIELGYGLQTDGMSAEMFFNRSFEPFFPYRTINKQWYDLYENEADVSSRYETDWRVFDWYHSSYEHNAWFAFPGKAGFQQIRDESTFVIESTPDADVHIEITEGGCHGRHAMHVVNRDKKPGGLAQDGKYCFEGRTYTFKGKFRGNSAVTVCMYNEDTVTDPVYEERFSIEDTKWQQVTAHFTVNKTGRYTFCALIDGGSELYCDDFTMMPDDNVCGWKKESIEAGKYVAPAVIRWPGGCFASFYNWHDGVGPDRPPKNSYFWGGYQYNDVGTDELCTYAREVGAESMICVNMHHPYKRFFDHVCDDAFGGDPNDRNLHAGPHGMDLKHFADIGEGAQEAANWVEYCNGSTDTRYGAERAENGHSEPYNVKYWELDNEIHRWYRPLEYAEACVTYSKAMKAVDPSVKIGMVSYSFTDADLPGMLEICGEYVDFFADRGCTEKATLRKLAIIDKYNENHEHKLLYANTEWLPLNGANVYNMVPRDKLKHNKCYMFSKWSYALDAASTLMMWQRFGQTVDFVNFNNLANTHAQSAIETAKEGSWVTAAGEMLHMFANTKAYRTLIMKNEDGSEYHPLRNDLIQVQLSESVSGGSLVVNILNRCEEDGTVEIDLSDSGVSDGTYEGVCISAPSLISMNRLNDRQISDGHFTADVRNGIMYADASKLSYGEVEIALKS